MFFAEKSYYHLTLFAVFVVAVSIKNVETDLVSMKTHLFKLTVKVSGNLVLNFHRPFKPPYLYNRAVLDSAAFIIKAAVDKVKNKPVTWASHNFCKFRCSFYAKFSTLFLSDTFNDNLRHNKTLFSLNLD